MRSVEETEKLAAATKLQEKLQRPENQLNVSRLLQVLTVKEIHAAKRQMSLIEDGFRKLQETSAAEGIRNESIDRQLEELRRDKEGFQQLISEAEATTQKTRDDLGNLRTKVTDEYFKLTADNVRFTKDIKTLGKQIDHHQEQFSTVENAIERLRSTLPEPQEMTKLNETLSRLEPMVRSVSEKVEKVSGVTDYRKESFMEFISDQGRIRTFLDAFIPKQERFFQFLDKLPELDSHTASYELSLNESMNGVNASYLSNSLTSGPQPPPKAHQMLEHYNHFSSSYRLKHPKSEARFIRAYLKKLDHRAAWFMQWKLHQEYPNLVNFLEHGETSNKTDVVIFINLDKLHWDHVKSTMRRIKPNELFSLLETDQGELDIPVPVQRPRKKRRTAAS
ncbi:hypothetical protein GGR54DRAFT_635896 [Hypoxylon sp. NC1633]|nr:hypothetical protein GGR54DRAFT_635896 [Hypoxylon sp. NC1633]